MEVLGQGRDEQGFWRRVRLPDGTERVQRPVASVEATITRADGTVEPGGEITNIRVEGVPCA